MWHELDTFCLLYQGCYRQRMYQPWLYTHAPSPHAILNFKHHNHKAINSIPFIHPTLWNPTYHDMCQSYFFKIYNISRYAVGLFLQDLQHNTICGRAISLRSTTYHDMWQGYFFKIYNISRYVVGLFLQDLQHNMICGRAISSRSTTYHDMRQGYFFKIYHISRYVVGLFLQDLPHITICGRAITISAQFEYCQILISVSQSRTTPCLDAVWSD